ncbi:MAG: HD domain-containing protein [Balneolales bacterium]|nr:HD domain-containing protein [Balneolales bacterium]
MKKEVAQELLEEWIEGENLRHHCRMVARAMVAYAEKLGKPEDEKHEWWLAGILHDLDWEKEPDEHPNFAINEIFPVHDISDRVKAAVAAHAPERTGKHPESEMERYLFACDELSGFMHAVSLMRPDAFAGMKAKSVNKKLKDKRFAANVSREDIQKGAELIETPLNEHIEFLAAVFEESEV